MDSIGEASNRRPFAARGWVRMLPMNARSSPFTTSQNPFVQGLSLLLGAVLLVGAIIVGAFLLAIAIGVGLVFALVIMARVWWIRRKLERSRDAATSTDAGRADGRVIDVEYTVVDEEFDDRQT